MEAKRGADSAAAKRTKKEQVQDVRIFFNHEDWKELTEGMKERIATTYNGHLMMLELGLKPELPSCIRQATNGKRRKVSKRQSVGSVENRRMDPETRKTLAKRYAKDYEERHKKDGVKVKFRRRRHRASVDYSQSKQELYPCRECGVSFLFEDRRRIHLEGVHREDLAYPCLHCSASFSTRTGLVGHFNRAHY